MRILYVVSRALEINTSASIRNHATISGFLENGHQITIVSVSPDTRHRAYDGTLSVEKVKKMYFDIGRRQIVAGISRNIKALDRAKPLIYKALYKNQIYDNLKGIVRFARQIDVDEFDVAISSSDPKSSHLFVDELFKNNKKQIPWIQIWGDPFADDITLPEKSKTKAIKEEDRLLKLADKIIYVSGLTCQSQKRKYPKSAFKMYYIPVPYLMPRVSKQSFPKDFRKMKICYCGDYNSKIRNIQPLYEAVRDLGMSFQICGMSDFELEKTDKISILPRQLSDKVRKFEDEADILVHLSNKRGTQIPGKIYQYVSTNKTILFILDGDSEMLKNIFKSYNRFIFVENQKERIKDTLCNIVELRSKINNSPLEYFSAENISKKILEPYDIIRG